MASTPHNTPRERSLEGLDPSIPLINGNVHNGHGLMLTASASSSAQHKGGGGGARAASPPRIGGGFGTAAIGFSLLGEEERRAREWRAMGAGMGATSTAAAAAGGDDAAATAALLRAGPYNPDLDKFLMERKTELFAANSFLFDKKSLAAASAPQMYEFSKASAVAHHLSSQPDHYSKMGSSAHYRQQQSRSRSGGHRGGSANRRAQSAAAHSQNRSSRILNRFDPTGSNGGSNMGNNNNNSLYAAAANLYSHWNPNSGGTAPAAAAAGSGGAVYAAQTGFQPLVPPPTAAADGNASRTLVPAAALNASYAATGPIGVAATIASRPHTAPTSNYNHPPSHIVVSPLGAQSNSGANTAGAGPHASSSSPIMHPTAAVFTDTTLNGTNRPAETPAPSPARLRAAMEGMSAAAASAAAAASSPVKINVGHTEVAAAVVPFACAAGAEASAAGLLVPKAAAAGEGAMRNLDGTVLSFDPNYWDTTAASPPPPNAGGSSSSSPSFLNRHTASSAGKINASSQQQQHQQTLQHSHPHSASYIAAQNYESYIRGKAGIGQVSAIENTDAILDALAAGEPDPATGFAPPHGFKASDSGTLRVLKGAHHLIDRTVARQGVRLGCCGPSSHVGSASGGSGGAALVPASGTRVDGLFVTYCQQDVHTQLDAARRELLSAEGQRQYDADKHREAMAALMHENARLREALHAATVGASHTFERMEQAVKDAVALKEVYDGKAIEAKRQLEETLAQRSDERSQIAALKEEGEAKAKTIVGLETTVFDLKRSLAVAEKQVQDVYKATQLASEEKAAAEGRAQQLQRQLQEMGVMLMNADKAYQGAEYGRRFAEDKINHMAFLMSTGQQRVASSKAAVAAAKGRK